jgi:hypothetical protein
VYSKECTAGADPAGVLSPNPELEGSFHVTGEIVIVHDITIAAAITNLKRLLADCMTIGR